VIHVILRVANLIKEFSVYFIMSIFFALLIAALRRNINVSLAAITELGGNRNWH